MIQTAVQIFHAEPGRKGVLLHLVREMETGKYRAPAGAMAAKKPLARSIVTAIVDSGLLHQHPLLRERVEESVDFTGEGIEDRNGHGTVVALVALAESDHLPRFLNVKVISEDGYGTEAALLEALEWLVRYKKAHPDTVLIANLSIGIYAKRWRLLPCAGGCRICKAAVVAGGENIAIVAAAGNSPSRTACPATVGISGKSKMVVPVGLEAHARRGTGLFWEGMDGGLPPFVPIQES